MKVLLTGVAGFIGSNIAEKLLALGHTVLGIDNLSTGHLKNLETFKDHSNFTFYKEDICDREFLEGFFRDEWFTHVCHQAARGSVPKSVEDPLLSHDVNVTGTINILWYAHKYGIKRAVCAISSAIYGDTPVLPKVETMSYNPISPYAVNKVADEMYCKVFYDVYGLETIWLRYFNVYGKRQDPNGAYAAIIPRWIHKALSGDNLELNGEWKQTRDFTYIDDVVEANILALTTMNADAFGKGMNICFRERTSIASLGETILHAVWSHAKLVPAPARKGDIQDSLWDYTLATQLIWYKPQTSIEKWIQEAINWYKSYPDYFSF